eukprot:IDg9518t1
MLEVAYAVASARPARDRKANIGRLVHRSAKVVPETFESKLMFQSKVGCLYQNKRTTGLNTRGLFTGMYEKIPI